MENKLTNNVSKSIAVIMAAQGDPAHASEAAIEVLTELAGADPQSLSQSEAQLILIGAHLAELASDMLELVAAKAGLSTQEALNRLAMAAIDSNTPSTV